MHALFIFNYIIKLILPFNSISIESPNRRLTLAIRTRVNWLWLFRALDDVERAVIKA